MTPEKAERAADTLQAIKEACENDKKYALAAYCIEMAQLEIALVLAKQDNDKGCPAKVLYLVE